MTDLLAEVIRCDLCAEQKERRYFYTIAAGGIDDVTVCQDCYDYEEKFMTEENKLDFLAEITIDEAIAEIRRELVVRENVYPDWIAAGRITEKSAHYHRHCLMAALLFLEIQAREILRQKNLF